MQQLHPKSVWIFFSKTFLIVFLALSAIGGQTLGMILALKQEPGIEGEPTPEVLSYFLVLFIAAFILAVGASYLWAKYSYKYYRYELVPEGFKKEYGIITKKYVTIPYDRIQNVDIYRGILARILGLSDLHIQTAGASMQSMRGTMFGGAEGRVPGLSHEVAEQLRSELVRRATEKKGSQGV